MDLDACSEIENDAVILRFLEGDVPMMTCSGDTVSGTKKREERSEAFIANPFTYSFVPVPMADEDAYFVSALYKDVVHSSCKGYRISEASIILCKKAR